MPTPPRPAGLARRALPALALGGASLVLLTRLDRPSAVDEPVVDTGTAAATSATSAAPAPPTTADPTRATTARPVPSAPAASAPPVVSTVPAPPPVTSTVPCTGAVTSGPVVQTRWGPVQVAAEISADGRLCDVEALQYPDGDRKSLMINSRALPVLGARAVAAQSASFQAVSGATVTSQGYRASLQAILDG